MNHEPFLEALERARGKKILVAAHERPDGDAIASLTATVGVLRDNGFDASMILSGNVPDNYESFVDRSQVEEYPSLCGLFITVDCSTVKRIASGTFDFPANPFVVEVDDRLKLFCRRAKYNTSLTVFNIDHHPDNEKFGNFQLIDPAAAATAEVLYHLFLKCKFRISPLNATRLLLGIVTDSGGFRFDNTGAGALRAAADLLELGADHHRIMVSAYCSKDPALARLEAELVSNHLKLECGGKLAYFVVTKALMARFGVEPRNTEGLIDAARNLNGVEFAAVLREEDSGFKISLRCKNPPYSVGVIARALGGGGHEMAAGAYLSTSSQEEAEKILVTNVTMEVQKHAEQTR